MKTKFKSAINPFYLMGVILFNIIIVVLITSRFYIKNITVSNYGIICLIIDLAFIIPMMIFTYYEFKEDYFLVFEYPFKKHKIKYENIFAVENGDFKTKEKKIVALSMNRLVIGYTDDKDEKKYMIISPVDVDLFLIKLGGKLKDGEALAEKKAQEISENMKEHNKRKKQWQKKKEELEKENTPEIIKANPAKKFETVKIEDEIDNNETSIKTTETQEKTNDDTNTP